MTSYRLDYSVFFIGGPTEFVPKGRSASLNKEDMNPAEFNPLLRSRSACSNLQLTMQPTDVAGRRPPCLPSGSMLFTVEDADRQEEPTGPQEQSGSSPQVCYISLHDVLLL